jgi:hypothetical protein
MLSISVETRKNDASSGSVPERRMAWYTARRSSSADAGVSLAQAANQGGGVAIASANARSLVSIFVSDGLSLGAFTASRPSGLSV